MSGESIVVRGTTKTLESNGASIANNAIGLADDQSYDMDADGAGFPDVEFVLVCTYGTAPTENAVISLMARPLDIDGTSDADVPEVSRPNLPIGSFSVNNVITTQTILINGGYAQDVPKKADYYLLNNGTGQSISAGWKLLATPRTRKAAP